MDVNNLSLVVGVVGLALGVAGLFYAVRSHYQALESECSRLKLEKFVGIKFRDLARHIKDAEGNAHLAYESIPLVRDYLFDNVSPEGQSKEALQAMTFVQTNVAVACRELKLISADLGSTIKSLYDVDVSEDADASKTLQPLLNSQVAVSETYSAEQRNSL